MALGGVKLHAPVCSWVSLITATDHKGPQWTATEADWGTTDRQELQKRWSELREPQGRQTEARETVMKCKGNGVSCQKLLVAAKKTHSPN